LLVSSIAKDLDKMGDLEDKFERLMADSRKKVEEVTESDEVGKATETGPEAEAVEASVSSSNVVIHVCDESRNLEKRFECDRKLLVDKMTYFKQYLNSDDDDDEEEVDISVHCDILVFEWLIQYISSDETPTLEVHNVVSILISSHFLQMVSLVEECIHFMSKYLNDIVRLPLDLSCLNEEIIKMISAKLSMQTIDLLNDPTDKIVSRLYRHHLELFIKQKEHKLFYCVYCGDLFTKQQRRKIICYEAPKYINFHGKIIRKHCAQKGWYICKYLLGLRLQSFSWKSIYWHCWSVTRPAMHCEHCGEWTTVPRLYHCSYHAKAPISGCSKGLNTLFFPCCQTEESHFEIIESRPRGCAHKQHAVSSPELQRILNAISTHSQSILVPFESSASCSVSSQTNRFLERPQSADHRSRLLKHSHHSSRIGMNHSKRFALNAPPKTTGVWDRKYFVLGSQSSSKEMNRNLQQKYNANLLDFDVYHKAPTFWYDGDGDEDRRNKTKSNGNEDSFEYSRYLLTFDNMDYGEGEEDGQLPVDEDEADDDLFTDDGSVDIDDVHDVMFFHSQNATLSTLDGSQQNEDPEPSKKSGAKSNDGPTIVRSPKVHHPKRKSKGMPIRGRRLKTVGSSHGSKSRFSVDVNSVSKRNQKSSSAFDIQQNDIRRLDALMRSLSENRQN